MHVHDWSCIFSAITAAVVFFIFIFRTAVMSALLLFCIAVDWHVGNNFFLFIFILCSMLTFWRVIEIKKVYVKCKIIYWHVKFSTMLSIGFWKFAYNSDKIKWETSKWKFRHNQTHHHITLIIINSMLACWHWTFICKVFPALYFFYLSFFKLPVYVWLKLMEWSKEEE